MQVLGLNQKTYKLTLKPQKGKNKSNPHIEARGLIEEVFGGFPTFEEVYIPGCSTKLYLDFFVPSLKLAVEVQGEQHNKFISAFHKNMFGYLNSRGRDNEKVEWCELNNIELVTLEVNEDYSKWRQKLIKSMSI